MSSFLEAEVCSTATGKTASASTSSSPPPHLTTGDETEDEDNEFIDTCSDDFLDDLGPMPSLSSRKSPFVGRQITIPSISQHTKRYVGLQHLRGFKVGQLKCIRFLGGGATGAFHVQDCNDAQVFNSVTYISFSTRTKSVIKLCDTYVGRCKVHSTSHRASACL